MTAGIGIALSAVGSYMDHQEKKKAREDAKLLQQTQARQDKFANMANTLTGRAPVQSRSIQPLPQVNDAGKLSQLGALIQGVGQQGKENKVQEQQLKIQQQNADARTTRADKPVSNSPTTSPETVNDFLEDRGLRDLRTKKIEELEVLNGNF